jgi:hypothetical protein
MRASHVRIAIAGFLACNYLFSGFLWNLVTKRGLAAAADTAQLALSPGEVTKKLQESIPEGRLDIDLKSGQQYVRCKLLKVTAGKDDSLPKAIKFQETEDSKPISVSFTAVRSITLDRQQIYAATMTGAKGKEALVERDAKSASAEREKWVARARAHNLEPWPELSAADHKREEKKVLDTVAKIKEKFPNTRLYNTAEFLFVSDMPPEIVIPYAKSLDRMYDLMCQMYGIKKGASVWKGKCLVVAFLSKDDFARYEVEIMGNKDFALAQGLCHFNTDGDVTMSCYCGDDPNYFGQVLVHETSHGFIHRYRTRVLLPNWANEGMADWIAQNLVQYEGGANLKRAQALQAMQQTHSLQGMLTEERIQPLQYGMAISLTDYLIQRDKRKYADWVNGMKEGKKWPESLKDTYGITPEQLLSDFGQAIGIPDLKP